MSAQRHAIGIGGNLLHAVSTDLAHPSTNRGSDGPPRYHGAECDTTVVVAPKWGKFDRGNERMVGHRLCARCAWTVALANDTLEEELSAVGPNADEALAWARLLPSAGLLIDTCRAILAVRRSDSGDDPDSSSWAHLLGHLCAHRPEILVPEDCAELDCDHSGEAGCYADTTAVACPVCSVRAGSWAGEWEDQYEVTVQAPCSVLLAIAAAYPGPGWHEGEHPK